MTGGSTQEGSVLVAQKGKDDAALLGRDLESRFPILPATSLGTAQKAIKANHLVGAILDSQFPDGDVFEFVAALREQTPGLPLLMVSSQHCADVLSRAHLSKVPLVHRGNCQENLRAFAIQLNTYSACTRDGIDTILEDLIQTKRLSLRESQILTVATYGIPRSYIARRLGLSENTIKTQVRSLLDKTKQANLSEVVWSVHSQALKNRALS